MKKNMDKKIQSEQDKQVSNQKAKPESKAKPKQADWLEQSQLLAQQADAIRPHPSLQYELEREDAVNKLILLYLLDKIKRPVSDLHITRILLENNLMNYFVLKDQLSKLLENGLVETDFTQFETLVYSVTEKGRDIISWLKTMIPIGIRMRIDGIIEPSQKIIDRESSIIADFTPLSESEFTVSVSALEDEKEFIELDIRVCDRLTAIEICDNWKKHTADIYKEIVDALNKKRD